MNLADRSSVRFYNFAGLLGFTDLYTKTFFRYTQETDKIIGHISVSDKHHLIFQFSLFDRSSVRFYNFAGLLGFTDLYTKTFFRYTQETDKIIGHISVSDKHHLIFQFSLFEAISLLVSTTKYPLNLTV